MKIAVKIAFMAAATIPAAASAQEAGRMLSLDEAVAVTLTENPALKAAAYEERAAQQQRQGKRQGNNSFHNLLPFLLVDIFPQICGLSQLNCVATLLLSMVLPSV